MTYIKENDKLKYRAVQYSLHKYSINAEWILRGRELDIIVNNHSKVPIYEQITNQIKTMIENGKLKEGDILPSMRGLAKSCQISVITAQKAYEDLQRDGYIETVQGKGTYVAPVEKQNAYGEVNLGKLQKCIEEINITIQKYQLDCDTVIQKLLEQAGKKGDRYE